MFHIVTFDYLLLSHVQYSPDLPELPFPVCFSVIFRFIWNSMPTMETLDYDTAYILSSLRFSRAEKNRLPWDTFHVYGQRDFPLRQYSIVKGFSITRPTRKLSSGSQSVVGLGNVGLEKCRRARQCRRSQKMSSGSNIVFDKTHVLRRLSSVITPTYTDTDTNTQFGRNPLEWIYRPSAFSLNYRTPITDDSVNNLARQYHRYSIAGQLGHSLHVLFSRCDRSSRTVD